VSGFTLDTSALIAAERGDPRMIALLHRAATKRIPLAIPGGALAQAWRADPRQHRLHVLLVDDQVEIVALDRDEALAVGALCARSGSSDVVDVSVVVCAQRRTQAAVTSDPDDLARIDPRLVVVAI
jgi:predicted nucleic acid-binding protein